MKKITAFLLALLMALSFAACAGGGETAETSAAGAESGTPGETSVSESGADVSKAEAKAEEEEAEAEAGNDAEADERRVLVAYFSATNTTEGVAGYVADALGAGLYEIVPEEPYTDDDLNYNDSNSRTTIEMNDPAARPAISGSVDNMDEYDIVFLGYPIWWGNAPRIISTFLESYDFSGKTIIPFCTSASSGIDSSAANLEALTSGAVWLDGRRFSSGSSRDEIVEWINSLGLDITAE